MSGRFVNYGVRFLTTVALLLAVVSSPSLLLGMTPTASPSKFLWRNFAIFGVWYIAQSPMSARSSLGEEDPLQSDTEDELDAVSEEEVTETTPPASVSFDLLPSPEPHSERVNFAGALASRPLRC
jgi:hypothetical protein